MLTRPTMHTPNAQPEKSESLFQTAKHLKLKLSIHSCSDDIRVWLAGEQQLILDIGSGMRVGSH